MVREIYSQPWVPEDPSVTKERDKKSVEELLARPEGKCSEQMKEILDGIDFDLLGKIFQDTALKYHIKEPLNFIGKERIFGIKLSKTPHYDDIRNVIFVADNGIGKERKSRKKLDSEYENFCRKLYGGIAIQVLHSIIHEEVHAAINKVILNGWEGFLDKYPKEIQNGYGIAGERSDENPNDNFGKNFFGKKHFVSFAAFNEGVTEKLAREIFLNYIKENNKQEEAIVYTENLVSRPEITNYNQEVSLVNAIVKHMSGVTGKSEEEMWEFFVGGMAAGETFENKQIREFFARIFGQNFLKDLSKISTSGYHGSYSTLIKKLKGKYNF